VARDFPDAVPAPRRAELMERLSAELDRHAGWLAGLGLRRTAVLWPYVHYESARVGLDVGYGIVHGPRLAVGATIVEHGEHDGRSLGAAQRLLGVPERSAHDTAIDREADLGPAVERLSEQLRSVEPLLRGDPEAFQGIRRRDKELQTANALEDSLRYAAQDADDAWRARDLERVIEVLEPLEGHLDRHQQGRLEYARRKRDER
jgi:hypothetical protein